VVNSSVLTRLQKQDGDEDRSWVAADREFQAAGPQTAKPSSVTWQSRARNYQITTWART